MKKIIYNISLQLVVEMAVFKEPILDIKTIRFYPMALDQMLMLMPMLMLKQVRVQTAEVDTIIKMEINKVDINKVDISKADIKADIN